MKCIIKKDVIQYVKESLETNILVFSSEGAKYPKNDLQGTPTQGFDTFLQKYFSQIVGIANYK